MGGFILVSSRNFNCITVMSEWPLVFHVHSIKKSFFYFHPSVVVWIHQNKSYTSVWAFVWVAGVWIRLFHPSNLYLCFVDFVLFSFTEFEGWLMTTRKARTDLQFQNFIHQVPVNICSYLMKNISRKRWYTFFEMRCTLCDSSMYDLWVKFDLRPRRSSQHLFPDQSDLLQTRSDFFVVQLQTPVLQIALWSCITRGKKSIM